MDSARPSNPLKLLMLKEAADKLAVPQDVLLAWNQQNILKPFAVTQTGDVCYTEEQINQFLTIRQFFLSNTVTVQPTQPVTVQTEPVSVAPVSDPQELSHPVEQKNSWKFFKFFPVIIAVMFILSVTAVVMNQKNSVESPVPISKENPSTKDLASSSSATQKDQATITPVAEVLSSLREATDTKPNSAIDDNTAEEVSTLASVGSQEQGMTDGDETKHTFAIDKSGNITSDHTNTNDIEQAWKGLGILADDSLKQGTLDLRNQLIFLSFGVLAVVFFAQRRFAYAAKKAEQSAFEPSLFPTASSEKLLELDQKMDGTVVLYSKGNEYRICKPELSSDSNQFIERLMELSDASDTKEWEYDSFEDKTLRLTTPLSKLVTRLGFVGVKRDLFFPRTSKHRVLFRRYITQEDLSSMNLTIEQVISDLN